ncbi:hypothetical protein QCA50_001226 [Cerrena zonata]|uniref:Uncharacterized protein n=1 Tax=Cerrena zonata TaxID=2478898 RepID=A0AAW0GSH8_9APHY
MTYSVDDLVASLGANHIGQEAMDLVALQKQLSQALPKPAALDMQKVNHTPYPQPYNTPTSRTPSTSFAFEQTRLARSRSCSVASFNAMPESISEMPQELGYEDDYSMDEDERMVDEMLYPSPVTTRHNASNDYSFHSHSFQVDLSPQKMYSPQAADYSEASQTSSFATTDPFYLAQLQASQAPPTGSHFTFLGRPPQQSPFVAGSQNLTRRSSIGRVSNFPTLGEPTQAYAFSAAAAR